jgi:hypothetical protein
MRTNLKRRVFYGYCLFVSIVLFGLTACATGGAMVNHSFSFDTINDSPDIEVLDYQYGGSRQFGTHPEKERVALGETFKAWGISGSMPRGEFLYVKWRVKNSGQSFEDKVDLISRLPADIEGLRVHFVIRGPQLYVYLIYPWDGKPWEMEPIKNRFVPVPGGVKRFEGQKQVQIYPDQPK